MTVKLGIDAGNYNVKLCGEHGLICFHSSLGESREINLQQVHGQDDMMYEYGGETGFAGSLAFYESEFSGSIMGTSKAHKDTKIRVLLGIHRYISMYQIQENTFDIVVGQPIIMHNQQEKEKMKQSLKGEHFIKVNGVEKSFIINRVEIAAECASSYWSNPKEGLTRIIDIGSGTINYATVLEGRYIDKDSNTLNFGVNTNKTNNLQALSRGITTHVLKKWNSNDPIFIIGGIAESILPHLKEYLPTVKVLYPIYRQQFVQPIFANAISFYQIAVSIYE